jgi:hypothetical protein
VTVASTYAIESESPLRVRNERSSIVELWQLSIMERKESSVMSYGRSRRYTRVLLIMPLLLLIEFWLGDTEEEPIDPDEFEFASDSLPT